VASCLQMKHACWLPQHVPVLHILQITLSSTSGFSHMIFAVIWAPDRQSGVCFSRKCGSIFVTRALRYMNRQTGIGYSYWFTLREQRTLKAGQRHACRVSTCKPVQVLHENMTYTTLPFAGSYTSKYDHFGNILSCIIFQ
jgi:hypothetical protein